MRVSKKLIKKSQLCVYLGSFWVAPIIKIVFTDDNIPLLYLLN